ncbi:MAG: TonB-dependent receptor [Sinobacteraceae bacterium]|nr:TonB-dependent receptor [Nevskiaceae bacterium]
MRFTPKSAAPAVSVAAAVATALIGSGYAVAQDNSDASLGLEEITVTARKVEENLMEVPLAITAFSEKAIEEQGLKQLTDVMRFTPSFSFANQAGGNSRNDRSSTSLVFRGLYLGNNAGVNAGGQLFVDGAPVFGAETPPMADVARIEVLKGPQSAYFGRSTFAGALNFIMKEPGERFGGRVSLEGSSFSSHDASLSLEAPIGDTLGARITLQDFKRGGYYSNNSATGGKLGEQTSQAIAGSLVWRPTDSLKIKFHGSLFENDDGPPAGGAIKASEFTHRVAPDGSCVPFSQAPAGTAALGQAANSRASFGYWCGEIPGLDAFRNLLSGDYNLSSAAAQAAIFNPNPNWIIFGTGFKKDGGMRRKASQADLRIDWEFGGGYTLSSLTATHFTKSMIILDLNYRDSSGLPNPFPPAANRPAYRQYLLVSQGRLKDWSQELRLTSPAERSFRWTLGANYISLFTPGGTVYGIAPTGPTFSASITEQDVATPSVFGGAYYDITDTLTASVEARYQEDEIKQRPRIATTGLPTTGAAANELSKTYTSFNPRVSLDWKYAPNSTLYALYSKGTRPGGFNSNLVTSPPAVVAALQAVVPNAGIAYEEEELDNYELGWKATWLNGRARSQLTFYQNTWKNGQVSSSIPVNIGNTANLIALIVNNGKADLRGVEFEGEFRVTQELRLAATFGYNDTEVKSFGVQANGLPNCTECFFIYGSYDGVIGNQLPAAPKVTYGLSADYERQLTGDLNWFARANFTHQGKKYTDLSNVAWIGDSNYLNLSFGIRNETWSVTAFANNVTDDDTLLAGTLGVDALSFGISSIPGNYQTNDLRFSAPIPRSYGLRFTYNF